MDNETPENETNLDFAMDLGKTLAINTAAAAGLVAGFTLSAMLIEKLVSRKEARQAKKNLKVV